MLYGGIKSEIFYSKTRKAFVTISEDESVNNITSDDFDTIFLQLDKATDELYEKLSK